jgi:glucokinase
MSAPNPATSAPVAFGGIDLGGTKIEAIVTNASYKVLGGARHPTPTTGGPADVANAMAAALTEAAKAASLEPSQLRGVGVGSPGTIDTAAGTVSRADNLPGWYASFPLAAALHSALGTTIALGNDVSVATNAEFVLGAGRPYRSLLGVFWGTGVGGGLILDGKIWRGRGGAGEIGHTVLKLGGRRCPCGRRGCLEAYAGRAAMERTARKAEDAGTKTKLFKIMEKRQRTRLTSGVWAVALEEEDKLARNLIDEAVEALGAGVGSIQNMVDVDAVVVGGGLGTRLGAPYVERIADAAQPHLFVDDRPPAFVLTELGDNGGGLGAALLVSS